MARQPKADLLEISAPAATGKSLYERVAGYLDANDWSYSAHEEQAYFSMNCRLKDGAVRVVVDVYEQDCRKLRRSMGGVLRVRWRPVSSWHTT